MTQSLDRIDWHQIAEDATIKLALAEWFIYQLLQQIYPHSDEEYKKALMRDKLMGLLVSIRNNPESERSFDETVQEFLDNQVIKQVRQCN